MQDATPLSGSKQKQSHQDSMSRAPAAKVLRTHIKSNDAERRDKHSGARREVQRKQCAQRRSKLHIRGLQTNRR